MSAVRHEEASPHVMEAGTGSGSATSMWIGFGEA